MESLQADVVHFKEVCRAEHTTVEAALAKMVVYESTGEVPHPTSSYGRMWAAYLAMKAVNPEIREEEDMTLGVYLGEQLTYLLPIICGYQTRRDLRRSP
jgi:hypothetical protein